MLTILALRGLPQVRPGDVLAHLVVDAADTQGTPLADRDCVVVTQKIVSKAEGRLVSLDPDDHTARRTLIESESARVLRRRGDLLITETRHGFVCANAGVDVSNVEEGTAALLPVDPDRSAKRIRDGIRAARGVEVGVVVSDTFGRAWRHGLTDVAIGVSGIAAVVDLRGTEDALGRELQVTEVAIADEIAGAAELVMGKATGVPVAIVRGLDAGWFRNGSARELIRPRATTCSDERSARERETMSTGHVSRRVPAFIEARRSIRSFLPEPVPRDVLDVLIEAACIAPAPHHSRPWRFVVVDTDAGKAALAEGMGARWRLDLAGDRVDPARIDALVEASARQLRHAPAVLLGCLTWNGLERYPDAERQRAEWGMALLSLGAAVENLMLTAAALELASCWVAAPIFCPHEARDALGLPHEWLPQALVLVGAPDPRYVGRPRPPIPLDELRARR